MPTPQHYILHQGEDAELGAVEVTALTINGDPLLATSILLGVGEVADLNGEADALVLDADADTTISAPTDDQVDIEVSGADDFRITANTFTALSGSTIATNTIAETTAGSGVTIDGVLVKDGGAVFADGAAIDVDIVNEATSAAGVTLDGVLLKDGGAVFADAATIEIDTINEATSAAGVTVDGALLKDGRSNLGRQVQALTESGAITIKSGVVTLAHDSVVIAATLAAPVAGDELFIINMSTNTTAHTLTVAGGVTLDGTNDVATLDGVGDALHLVAVSATRWFIMENIGTIGLS